MINVSELITDNDFAITFTIHRSTGGDWVNGLFVTPDPTDIIQTGIIQPYNPKNTEYDPNGNIITGDIKIWSLTKIYLTRDDIENEGTEEETADVGFSDTVEWNGDLYKVTSVKYWNYHGYYSAIASKVAPNE